ncbi:hypothetical protein [Neptuniibacter sp. QD37_11]|uniref:hypothetical protein n=1 Tax=Neptuniibacter sp. QD37_11 TaxID=3398209 RepID=UPI0039F5716A
MDYITEYSAIADVIMTISFMIGLVMMGLGFVAISRSQATPQTISEWQAIRTIFVGGILLGAPVFYGIIYGSLAGSPVESGAELNINQAGINELMGSDEISGFMALMPDRAGTMIFGFVWIFGLISYLRGLFMLKDVGFNNTSGGGQNGIAKPITHIIGGIACMNIADLACFVGKFFGIGMLCGG